MENKYGVQFKALNLNKSNKIVCIAIHEWVFNHLKQQEIMKWSILCLSSPTANVIWKLG